MLIAKELAGLIKKVHLGGLINECVLESTGTSCKITAQDYTNTVLACVTAPIEMVAGSIGIGNIPILLKYLAASAPELNAVVADNRLLLSAGKTNFRYRITDPSVILSAVIDFPANAYEQACEIPWFIEIPHEFIQEMRKLTATIGANEITLRMGQRGRMTLTGGATTNHMFDMVIGDMAPSELPFQDLEIHLQAAYFSPVLVSCNPEQPIVMYIPADGECVLITQDVDVWKVSALIGMGV